MTTKTPITVAYGDGIGPAIMEATLDILEAAGARIEPEVIEIGEKVYKASNTTGIAPESWASLKKTKVFLKAPITTPSGGGYKSLNVTVRKTLGLFANVRPCVSYHPFVTTNFPNMDVVIVRENEEDLYAGIEYRQSQGGYAALKLLSRPGAERIIRYAFEYARANGRKKVTCMVKDNIMKFCDGMFYAVFEEIAAEYPEIDADRMIVDIGSARVAARPNDYDVIVTLNLYGDIISDIAAEVTGSVGLGGSANIGQDFAMFEAIHGSAPDIAGQGIANPSGLLLGAVMMLVHIGQSDIAENVHNAWLKTLEDGIHTGEIYKEGQSKERVGTDGFSKAVIDRLGQKPTTIPAVSYPSDTKGLEMPPLKPVVEQDKKCVGTDLYLDWNEGAPDDLAKILEPIADPLDLKIMTNRGVKVWPNGDPATFCTDTWRCRYVAKSEGAEVSHADIVALYQRVTAAGLDVVKSENLYTFDDERGYSLAQGE